MSRAQLTSTVEQSSGGVVAPFLAGKNKIISGDFSVWQRGTTFSYTGSGATLYSADRYTGYINGNGTFTFSQQAFTPGAAPVAGYESAYFHRITTSSVGTSTSGGLYTKIEDVRTLAGQTATFSFWAKADSTRTMSLNFDQVFGTGGSSAVSTYTSINWSIGTSWARYTVTFAIPSISGKTIGTGSYIQPWITFSTSAGFTFDTWGWQLEAGSVATPFTTASGTLQGELALAMRYYQTNDISGNHYMLYGGTSSGGFTSNAYNHFILPVPMRAAPTVTFYAHDNSSGAVSLYGGASAVKSTSVSGMTAYVWGWSGNFTGSSWGTNADTGMLAYGYQASAEL